MITALQCKMARAATGWGVRELAAKADVSASTVNRFERGGAEPHSSTLRAIRQTFDAAGIEFIPGGARLREQAAEAQAS